MKEPSARGFGSALIEQGITYELDGTAQLEFLPDGLCCIVEIPWAEHVRQPGRH